MLKKRNGIWFTALLVVTDAAAGALGLFLSYWLRFGVRYIPVTKGYRPSDYIFIFPIAIILWIISLNLVHLYRPRKRVFSFEAAWQIVKGSFLATFILVGLNFLLREAQYSRPVVIMAPFLTAFFLCIFRFIISRILVKIGLQKGVGRIPVFIIGTGRMGKTLADRILKRPEYGYSIVGFFTDKPEEKGGQICGVKILGEVKEILEYARKKQVSEVMLARTDLKSNHIVDFIMDCERELITVHIVPDLLEIMTTEISVNEVGGVPLFGLKETPLHGLNLIIKRAFDVMLSFFFLIFVSPFMLAIALLIRMESKGPVIYPQKRLGMDGHEFTLYKFRSMTPDAEKDGPAWACSNDPRCTKVGAFLRAHNLDELPQFYNVLKGDMSLVGPRPERPYYVEKFKNGIPRYMARHRVKSGITGWAQVNGLRGDSSIPERLKYDLFYIENWSLLFDVKILIMTLFTFH